MSRSYCKPNIPYHINYKEELNYTYTGIPIHYYSRYGIQSYWYDIEAKHDYYAKKHTNYKHSFRFPHYYRNLINRTRRHKDRHELYKEITNFKYEGLYSKWNCKDADPWWYW